jgi:Na+-transporting methylmalonyl-CoA/oxaloacetate decarboxylase gamma subunit
MSPAEALTVTALGIGVVFSGLLLCLVCMKLLARVAGRVTLADPHAAAHAPAPVHDAARATPAVSEGPIPDEVLAVIVAVLEVERALYVGRYRSRLTLRRPAVPPAAGETP